MHPEIDLDELEAYFQNLSGELTLVNADQMVELVQLTKTFREDAEEWEDRYHDLLSAAGGTWPQ